MTEVERLRGEGRWDEGLGFLPGVAAGLLTLGEVAVERGRPEQGKALLEEARDLEAKSGTTAFLPRIEAALAELT